MKTKKTTLALALILAMSTASLPSVSYAQNTPEENAVAGVITAIVLCAFFCGSDDSQDDYSSQSDNSSQYYEQSDYRAPEYNSAPVQPINSFYGDCHSPMGC